MAIAAPIYEIDPWHRARQLLIIACQRMMQTNDASRRLARADYLAIVVMRTLAVILIAWPASFALARFAVDLDFYWFALILGAPLFALSLWQHSATILPRESRSHA